MLAVCLLAATWPVISARAERGDVAYYDLPDKTSVGAMVAALDGSLWLAGSGMFRIVIVTPEGDVDEFLAPPGSGQEPRGMAVGPDGNIWIAELEFAKVVRVTPAHEVTVFQLPAQTLRSIAAGPDGNLWVTGYHAGSGPSVIYRVTLDGQATEFPLPAGRGPADHIMAGPDGRMWFTEYPGQRIGAIAMDGTIDEIGVPVRPTTNLALGSDGNVWFGAEGARLVRLTAEGDATEFSLPGQIYSIVAGADGALWASAPSAEEILTITTTGEVEEFPLGHSLGLLAASPDGSIWFQAFRQGQTQVGRLDSGAPAPAAPAFQRVRAGH
jgi:virginiamycin B lyase